MIKKWNRILVQCGGGGGYGDPKDRDVDKVLDDYKQEYISLDYIKRFYPHVNVVNNNLSYSNILS